MTSARVADHADQRCVDEHHQPAQNKIAPVHIAAMGELELVGDVEMRQQQPLALLCYLSIEGPKTRRHLATVFWPEAKQPLNNLSSALTRIRERLPRAITGDGTRLSSNVTTDVGILTHAIERLDTETILQVYRGHFFEAADIRSTGLELEEWIFSTRDTLAQATSEALLTAAENHRELDPGRSGELAESAYTIGRTIWTNASLWQRCFGLLSTHGKVAAERVRIGAAEAGIEIDEHADPSPATNDGSTAADEGTTAAVPAHHHNHLETTTGLFGRHEELHALGQFVSGDAAGWLCIVGMGGIGKTAVARAFSAQVRHQRPGTNVAWVSLAELGDASQIGEAVAASFDLPYVDEATLVEAIERKCDPLQPTVLVLDNLEHLTGFESTLSALGAMSGVRMIVTSRIVTDLPGEVVVRLKGLTSLNQTQDAALAMFTARSMAAYPAIVDEPDLAHQVCHLVDGLPLAIELCAGWLRSVPLSVLVDSLTDSVELLEASPSRDLESIDSVLERSWGLLDPSDASVLNQLSLFEGSFSFEEALAVTQSSLTTITSLIDRSLVTRGDQRLELHPLVRAHARGQVQADVQEQASHRLLNHFRTHLVQAGAEMRGPGAGSATAALAETYPNIEAAWHIALNTEDWQAVTDMVDGLDQHLKSRSRQYLTARLFKQALDALETHADAIATSFSARQAYVAIGWRYAFARTVQGDLDDAERALVECADVCDDGDRLGLIGIAYTQGHKAIFSGEYDYALTKFDAARAMSDDSIPGWLRGEINSGTGLAAMSLGDMPRARTALRAVLDAGRKSGNPVTLSSAYYSLGAVEITDQSDLALVLLEEGRAVAEQAGLSHMLRKFATLIGRCHVKQNEPDAAITVFTEAVQDAEDEWQTVKEPWVLVCNQTGLGMAHALAGDTMQADQWFTRALRAEVELQDWPLMLETVLEICAARVDAVHVPAWRELLSIVVNDPASIFDWRVDARALFDRVGIEPILDLTDSSSAEPMRLDVVAEKALTLLRTPRADGAATSTETAPSNEIAQPA